MSGPGVSMASALIPATELQLKWSQHSQHLATSEATSHPFGTYNHGHGHTQYIWDFISHTEWAHLTLGDDGTELCNQMGMLIQPRGRFKAGWNKICRHPQRSTKVAWHLGAYDVWLHFGCDLCRSRNHVIWCQWNGECPVWPEERPRDTSQKKILQEILILLAASCELSFGTPNMIAYRWSFLDGWCEERLCTTPCDCAWILSAVPNRQGLQSARCVNSKLWMKSSRSNGSTNQRLRKINNHCDTPKNETSSR